MLDCTTFVASVGTFMFKDADIATYEDRPYKMVYDWLWGNDFYQQFGEYMRIFSSTHVIFAVLSIGLIPVPGFFTLKGSDIHKFSGLIWSILFTLLWFFGALAATIIISTRSWHPCAYVIVDQKKATSFGFSLYLHFSFDAVYMAECLCHGLAARILVRDPLRRLNKIHIYLLSALSINSFIMYVVRMLITLTMIIYYRIVDRNALACMDNKVPGGVSDFDFYANLGLFIIQGGLLLVTKTNYDFTQLMKHVYIDNYIQNQVVNSGYGLTEIPSIEWRRQHGRNLVICCAMAIWVMIANIAYKVLPLLAPISLAVMAFGTAIYWHCLDDHVIRLKRKKLLMEKEPSIQNQSSLSATDTMQAQASGNFWQKFCASYQMSFEFTKGPAGVELAATSTDQTTKP